MNPPSARDPGPRHLTYQEKALGYKGTVKSDIDPQSKYRSDEQTNAHVPTRFCIFAFASAPRDRENLLGVPVMLTPLPMEKRFSYITAQKK
jgi:hypothetical protein